MLSDDAESLARLLRSHVGPDAKGVGPDVSQLVALWDGRDLGALRPAIDELARRGFVRVDIGLSMGARDTRLKRYDLRNVVSVTVLEPMQAYLDERE